MTYTTVDNFITQHNLIPPDSTIIIGLSGGPDSVFLLHYLNSIKTQHNLTLIAAHLNHGWRTEATHDEQFCRTLAEQLDITFVAAHAKEFPHITNNGSAEAHGRNLRRAFFARLLQNYPQARVALAHHRNDQIETFFVRLMRGAGLEGLCGMQPQSDGYIRPLLGISKAEILAYLHERNIPYCIDHTNEEDAYLRNRIRNHALPVLKQCDARIEESVMRTMGHFEQIHDFVEQEVIQTCGEISEVRAGTSWISLAKFFALHPFMQQQILLHWLCKEQVPFTPSKTLFEEIMRFLRQPAGGTHRLYQHWGIIKKQAYASIAKR